MITLSDAHLEHLKSERPVRLRSHHLLCMQTFVGNGYSEAFVENMKQVLARLAAEATPGFMLAEGADDLCAACPNLVNGQCTSQNPGQFDALVMKCLSTAGEKARMMTEIPPSLRMTEELLEQCCPGCEWKDLCREVCGCASGLEHGITIYTDDNHN
ncbi:MAG: DUF1284 domain-containing protein [Lachnospiraceae bacterium]|nr:DUF1284 domain-containing protein [Lachnospiraceae bacterium]